MMQGGSTWPSNTTATSLQSPHNAWALYELSYSLFAKGDFQQSLDVALQGTDYDSPYLERFYLMAANNLDNLGRSKEAIAVYERAIEEFPDEFLLHYNLGVTQYGLGEIKSAKENFKAAVALEPTHPSSHLALASILQREQNNVVALFALTRFLTLEPQSPRSENARNQLLSIMQGGAKRDPSHSNQINITLNPNTPKDEGDFGAAEVMLGMLAASRLSKQSTSAHNPSEDLVESFRSLFQVLSELPAEDRSGFGWEYYAPYFMELQRQQLVPSLLQHIFPNMVFKNALPHKFLKWSEDYRWPAVRPTGD